VCLNRVQPSKYWALVICATASVHAALVVDAQCERVRCPAVRLVGGLYIVVTVDEYVDLLRVISVASEEARWEVEVFASGLLSKLAELDGATESLDLVCEPVAHLIVLLAICSPSAVSIAYLHNIRPPPIFRADTRDGDRFPQPLDKRVLQTVHLLEVSVKVCHLVERSIQVGPRCVRYAIRRVFVETLGCEASACRVKFLG
jgi:hypothetical protein